MTVLGLVVRLNAYRHSLARRDKSIPETTIGPFKHSREDGRGVAVQVEGMSFKRYDLDFNLRFGGIVSRFDLGFRALWRRTKDVVILPDDDQDGRVNPSEGRFDEALSEARRAQELDPRSHEAGNAVGRVLFVARRYDEALIQFRMRIEMDPNDNRKKLSLLDFQKDHVLEPVVKRSLRRNPRRRDALRHAGQFLVAAMSFPDTHSVGDKSVEGRPCLSDVRREARPEPLLECPEERLPDGFVIVFIDPIAGVASAQRGEGGQERLRAVKSFDRQREHLHQLASLLLNGPLKKRPERGIEFEQTSIEQGGGHIRDGPDLRKARLHQCLLNHIHNHSPYLWRTAPPRPRLRVRRSSPLTCKGGNGKANHSLKEKITDVRPRARATPE